MNLSDLDYATERVVLKLAADFVTALRLSHFVVPGGDWQPTWGEWEVMLNVAQYRELRRSQVPLGRLPLQEVADGEDQVKPPDP